MCIRPFSYRTLIVLAWIFPCGFTFSQPHPSDSIVSLLAQLPSDSARLATCIENVRHNDPEIANIFLDYGKQLAIRNADRPALAKLITEEAIGANIRGEHLEGARYFLKVDSIYRLMDDSLLMAGAQTNTGLSYYHAGQYDQALTHYFEAYRIYQGREPSTGFSRLLNNLAICCKRTDNLAEAKRYYVESIAVKKILGDSAGYANTQHNLALLLSAEGELSAAINAFDTAIAIYHSLGMQGDEASSRVARGKAMLDAGQLERASDDVLSGYLFFKTEAPASKEFMLAAGEMTRLELARGQWHKASGYIEEALALTEDADRIEERIMLLDLKAKVLNGLDDGAGAYAILREVMTLRDSLYSKERRTLTEEMQTRFSVVEKENDLRVTQLALDGQRKISRIYQIALIAALVVALLIGALGVFLYRSRREIRRSNKIIAAALQEKEHLLKEIHHRVKNNLQVISSLLGMQSFQSHDPNVSHAMREGQNRVHAMSLIHQTLYRDQNVIEVNARDYVEKLLQSLRTAYRVDGERIIITTDVDALKLDVDLMIPLGLILNELLTNALKYAFPDGREGNIVVVLKRHHDTLTMQVRDNGVGMSDPDRLKQSQSMGYTLVTDFCAKLKATVEVRSDHGTEILINIPVNGVTTPDQRAA